ATLYSGRLLHFCGRARYLLPRLKASAQTAVQELFCAAIKIQIVFRTLEAMAFVGIHDKRALPAILADGFHDLFRLGELYPGIKLPVADQQWHANVGSVVQRREFFVERMISGYVANPAQPSFLHR